MIDWNFVYDGMKSIHWLRKCNDLPEEYGQDAIQLSIGDVWEKTYQPEDREHRLLNTTVLMMAAYIYFVYPKEKLEEIDLARISINDFEILEQEKEHDKKALISRLRNAVAHANYEIQNHKIKFTDFNPRNGANKIIFMISVVDFGVFIEKFRFEVYKQKVK